MPEITDLLDQYPSLTLDERLAVDARVRDQAEWAEAWAEARQLAMLADALDITPEDVARAAVDRRMGNDVPDAEAVDRALASDTALAAEAARTAARLDALDAASADPVARFERLSGLLLDPPTSAPQPATPRPPRAGSRLRPLLRRLQLVPLAAAGLLVALYGSLLTLSSTSDTPRQQVAALSEIETAVPDVLRGPDAISGSDQLAEALATIEDARHSVLGLFPRYDGEDLNAAAPELADVVRGADPRSWVSQEARLALGRVLVYQGRDTEAARVLGGLVREGSYRASAARRLLDFVRSPAAQAD